MWTLALSLITVLLKYWPPDCPAMLRGCDIVIATAHDLSCNIHGQVRNVMVAIV